jgi:cytochrome d ubiquinol oxidase subunit I
VVGAASGITMEFSFGNNWSGYARAVGDIFGPILAVEAVAAFFLESVFIGVLVFGRRRVSPFVYWLSALLVFAGSHLSAFWIIVANSWMQTPAGYDAAVFAQTGKIVLADFSAAVLNPSTVQRFLHTVMASWMTCAVMISGIAAYMSRRGRADAAVRKLLVLGVVGFAATPVLQLGTGHLHAIQVGRTQPAKMAAFEGLHETTEGAPMYVAGWVDGGKGKTRGIAVPGLLSFLLHFDFNARVTGLEAFAPEDRPNVNLVFQAYHVMVAVGMLSIGAGLFGLWLLLRGRLHGARAFLWLLPFWIPLPHIAHEAGWISAEVGRQPWIIQGMMRTSDAASPVVPAGHILLSLVLFALAYLFLGAVFLSISFRLVSKGLDAGVE